MITFTSAQLNILVMSFLWPLTRILGLLASAPLFGNVSVPATVKISLGILIAMIITPTLPALPALDPLSLSGALTLAQQMLIGLAMGFVMQVIFAGVALAGEAAGLSMGLGFATFFDPQTQGRSIAVTQFLSLMMLLMYMALDVHLAVITALADSFRTMPINDLPFHGRMFEQLAFWGGKVFASGVQLALPVVAALLITNVGLSILARSAPQLNLFGIGFPITLTVGFVMLAVTVPYMAGPLEHLFQDGLEMIKLIAAPEMLK